MRLVELAKFSLLLPLLLASASSSASPTSPLLPRSADPSGLPPAILGTYNLTFLVLPVSPSYARSLLPAYLNQSLVTELDQNVWTGLGTGPGGDGQVPVVLELGREANCGPPLLRIENFQEAKVTIPNIARLGLEDAASNTSGTRLFTYKKSIFVDSALDVIGSWAEYGLSTSNETFVPANSSDSASFDYAVEGKLNAHLRPVATGRWPRSTYESISQAPWFGDGPLCAQHFYQWNRSAETIPVTANVTLYPPYAGPNAGSSTTVEAWGQHAVASFKIVGPLPCEAFASP